MWLFTKHGTYSVVQHLRRPDTYLIRSRRRQDLVALCEATIVETPLADYPYRVFVSTQTLQQILRRLADQLDYPNFKNAVAAVEPARARWYSKIWELYYNVSTEDRP